MGLAAVGFIVLAVFVLILIFRNEKQASHVCNWCGERGDDLERFVVAEDAIGPILTEYFHPECRKRRDLTYLSLGVSPRIGYISPFTEVKLDEIPEEVVRKAAEELRKSS